MIRLGALLLAVAALATAAGCGSDDNDDTASTTAASTQPPTEPATTPERPQPRHRKPAPQSGHAPPPQPGPGPARGTSTPKEFIGRADRICDEARQEFAQEARAVQDLLTSSGQKRDPADLARSASELTAKTAEIGKRALARLEALPRPKPEPAALGDYFRNLRKQIGLLEELDPANPGDSTQELTVTGTATHDAATKVGFRSCGTPPT